MTRHLHHMVANSCILKGMDGNSGPGTGLIFHPWVTPSRDVTSRVTETIIKLLKPQLSPKARTNQVTKVRNQISKETV
jgi:hypothetical protein